MSAVVSLGEAVVAEPRVALGTGLARLQHPGLPAQTSFARPRREAGRRQILSMALPWLKAADLVERRRLPHPLDHLVVGDQIDVVERKDLVEEAQEALAVDIGQEPARVVEDAERGPIRLVVAVEVVHQHLVSVLLILRIEAGIYEMEDVIKSNQNFPKKVSI